MIEQNNERDPILALLLDKRRELGLRQQEVADRAGISRRALVSIEAGNDCTLSTLRSLCKALDIDLQASASTGRKTAVRPSRRSLRSTAQLSDHQADRELAEALRVQGMPAAEFSSWLEANWGRLLEQADILYGSVRRPAVGEARHFKTMEDKNRFDEKRETEFAVSVSTLDVDGMLISKQTTRETDLPDRLKLQRLRNALRDLAKKQSPPSGSGSKPAKPRQ